MRKWKIFEVEGSSMAPTLEDGDFVTGRPFDNKISVGDVVVIEHPKLGKIIKRVASFNEKGQFKVSGDSPTSISSEEIGAIESSQISQIICYRVNPYSLCRV